MIDSSSRDRTSKKTKDIKSRRRKTERGGKLYSLPRGDRYMQLHLTKTPKSPTVIEGFPGFGLVGTITTEFLIDHLKCEQIGRCWFENALPTIAIHQGEIIDPISVYYNKKFNIVIVHSITNAQSIEWQAAEVVQEICKATEASEVICIEGVGSPQAEGDRVFYYSSNGNSAKKLTSNGVAPLGEGIIVGVTSAILLKSTMPTTCLFAETHSNLPDSKAAAHIIQILDSYLGLDVDPQPLLKKAEEFERKLKNIIEQSSQAQKQHENKDLRYMG